MNCDVSKSSQRPLRSRTRAGALGRWTSRVAAMVLWVALGAATAAAQGGGDLLQGFDTPLPGAAGAGGDSLEQGFSADLPQTEGAAEAAAEPPSVTALARLFA